MLEVLLSSSVLIAVLAVMRPLLRGHVRPGLQYALWLAVLVRLLIPVSFFDSSVGVAAAAAPAVERVERVSGRPLSSAREYFTTPDVTETPVAQTEAASSLSLRQLALAVWLAGAVVMGVWFLLVNGRLRRSLGRTRRIYTHTGSLMVYVAEGLPSPCLYGVFRPAVYLTEQAVADDRRAEAIIAHELTHYRHWDNIWAFLRVLCLIVYWFDPFVWLAASLSRRDGELCCDAATIKILGEERRYEYGRALVDMTAARARPGDLLCGATTMTGAGRSLRERVKLIAQKPKTSALAAAAALLVAAVAVGCTFSGAAEEYEPRDEAFYAPYVEAAQAHGFEGWYVTGNEFLDYYIEYLYACETGWEEWSSCLLFSSDDARRFAEENYAPLQFGAVETMERINDNLYAFLVYMQDYPDLEPRPCWQFVGRLDGRLYVFRNPDSVPAEISQDFDAAGYPDMGGGEVLGDASAIADYTGELQEVFSGFFEPESAQVSLADGYTPEPQAFSLSLEELIFSTDAWVIRYESVELPENEPEAAVTLTGGAGGTLYIRSDVDGLIVTGGPLGDVFASFGGGTGREMVDMILDWARGY